MYLYICIYMYIYIYNVLFIYDYIYRYRFPNYILMDPSNVLGSVTGVYFTII